MKKLIFCCLVVLMGACKDKNKEVEPEADFAPDFVGTYATTTVASNIVTNYEWVVTNPTQNQLAIVFKKTSEIAVAGTKVDLVQTYKLVNVKVSSKDVLEINETVDVEQSNNQPLKQKVEGVGTKIVNAGGVPQVNIKVRLTDSGSGTANEEYLEFKRK